MTLTHPSPNETPIPAGAHRGRHVKETARYLWWEGVKSEVPHPKLPQWIHRPSRLGSQLGLASLTAGLMLTTYSLPAYAADTPMELTVAAGVEQQQLRPEQVQTMSVSAKAVEALPELQRDSYSVTLPPPPPVKKVEKAAKPSSSSNKSKASAKSQQAPARASAGVIWPVGAGVRFSDGFGPRRSPCGGCSSNHKGLDMLPGNGATVRAVADGTVSEVGGSEGGYGVYVIVDHVVDGKQVSSLYAHMQWGSPTVSRGQHVSKGQPLGRVGSTGASTGPHLHLEIRIGGTPVDPYAWLSAHD